MSRDEARSALSNAVAKARRVLVGDRKKADGGDIGAQLEAPFGFDPKTGVPKPMDRMVLRSWERGRAEMLRAWHAHLTVGAAGATEEERARAAYDQMRYELGYTALHRLAALRMAEERTIVRECVRRGRDSDGFKMYLNAEGGSGLGAPEAVYAFFLERLYDELARDLPAVFDRRSAASLVAPTPKAISEVLEELNREDLGALWGVDETLGWIFEDYNDPDERKEMRKHDAPRNARELAVRNQFFTPRWVVEFLTDNTLGRLWYDLTGGKTELSGTCRFLLKPALDAGTAGCRDPREIKVLDPACGSGHFLLYVYELLETVYREAWVGRHHRSPERKPLWEEYPDEEAFLREIPRLILEHNVHGVDIDPRCIQEAGVALWLRAHRSWDKLGVKPKDRPRIARVNLVCAQALSDTPGLKDKLRKKLKPEVLGRLVDTLFLRMGEMGVLFRVETAIRDTVESVKKEYLVWKRETAQRDLFGQVVGEKQTTIEDFAKLQAGGAEAEKEFWEDADKLLLRALDGLAEEAEDKDHYRSRLFAEDVRHGLEFFDVSRIKYDVVLMNPPFGVPTESTKGILFRSYPNAGGELYAMFYERGLELVASGGRVGGITSRTWLALPTLEPFRRQLLGDMGRVEAAADLGYGVLNAKVETAAAVVRRESDLSMLAPWVRLVNVTRKSDVLADAACANSTHRLVFATSAQRFDLLPAKTFGYWMSDTLVALCNAAARLESRGVAARKGAESGDDSRHIRLTWEVTASEISSNARWLRLAKGGEHRRFADDVHLVIRVRNEAGGTVLWRRGRAEWFGKSGVTWPHRTACRLSARALPSESAFGEKGPSAHCATAEQGTLLLLLNSRPVYLLLLARLGSGGDGPGVASKSYDVSLIRELPWPQLKTEHVETLTSLAPEAVDIVRLGQIEEDDTGETVVAFAVPPVLLFESSGKRPASMESATRARVSAREDRLIRLAAIQGKIDDIVADAYAFSERDRQLMDDELEPALTALPGTHPINETQFRKAYLSKNELDGDVLPGGIDAELDVRVEHRRKKQVRLRDETTLSRIFQAPPAQIAAIRRRLALLRADDLRRAAADIVSYAVGVAFGRWDIRLWAHPEWIPTFAGPFDPMPACPLGQLVDGEGLPATEKRVASEAWLEARKHPTTLPLGPPGIWELSARDYPLPVAWNGILTDDLLDDPRRPQDGFLARVDAVLEHLFGVARPDWEQDIAQALGVKSITEWLRAPSGFFDDHLDRYSKSHRSAPLYWPIATPSGGLTFWVYAPRFDGSTLPLLANRLRADVENLRHERDVLRGDAAPDPTKLARVAQLVPEIDERQTLLSNLEAVLAWGYAPHPDDGFAITASPLNFAFHLPKWRDLLATTWRDLERGDYDWAHMAMRRRPTEVLEKCKGDLSIAIAHGRAELYISPEKRKMRRARKTPDAKPPATKTAAAKTPARKMKQTTMLTAGDGHDDEDT